VPESKNAAATATTKECCAARGGGWRGVCVVRVWLRSEVTCIKIPPPDFFPLKEFSRSYFCALEIWSSEEFWRSI
jgi:hypothetical protein